MMNRMLDTRQLQTLVEVMRTGSFQAAAESLCCVPSAISNRMKALTEAVGVVLFVQDGRKVQPTAECERLTRYAKMILALCERAVADAKLRAAKLPPLRLGVIDTAAGVYLPDWLRRLKDEEPDLQISVETGHSIPLIGRVLSGALDAAFVAGSWEHAQLTLEYLIPEELVLITPKEPAPSTASLWDTALAFSCPCTYRARLEQWAISENIAIKHIIEFGSVEAIIGSVAAGLGFSVLPRSVLQHSRFRSSLTERSIPKAISRIPTVLVRNAEMPRHGGMTALISAVSHWHGAMKRKPFQKKAS